MFLVIFYVIVYFHLKRCFNNRCQLDVLILMTVFRKLGKFVACSKLPQCAECVWVENEDTKTAFTDVNRIHFYPCGYSKCVSVTGPCLSILIVELESSKHQFLRNKKTIHNRWSIGFSQYAHLSPSSLIWMGILDSLI